DRQQGRLARTGRADHRHELTRPQVQVEVGEQHPGAGEGMGQAPRPDALAVGDAQVHGGGTSPGNGSSTFVGTVPVSKVTIVCPSDEATTRTRRGSPSAMTQPASSVIP